MSSERDQARLLAERIARRVSQGAEGDDRRAASGAEVGEELAVMRAGLEDLQQRLARIESRVTRREDGGGSEGGGQGSARRQTQPSGHAASRSPWLSGMYVPAAAHPSQEKFGVEEAAVSELVDFFEGEKKCELEPGGKPCDHCAMCSTRGF
ncbi:MAG TPA: hypothetical protein VN256_04340 [Pyrinomonadaceae bacterium]|nr:hypothetical protein [Pyrinomonadaceae bacterium]